MSVSLFVLLVSLFYNSMLYAAEIGKEAPYCLSAQDGSSNPLDLKQYEQKVVLIDFWATWCPPCKKSMPFLNGLRNEHQDKGFEIVAINVDENSGDAQNYLTNNPVDYPIFFDPEGKCPAIFDVKAMPSSYLIDKSGKVRVVHLGFRNEDESFLREQVLQLLSE